MSFVSFVSVLFLMFSLQAKVVGQYQRSIEERKQPFTHEHE